jgi:hypothetical protein
MLNRNALLVAGLAMLATGVVATAIGEKLEKVLLFAGIGLTIASFFVSVKQRAF